MKKDLVIVTGRLWGTYFSKLVLEEDHPPYDICDDFLIPMRKFWLINNYRKELTIEQEITDTKLFDLFKTCYDELENLLTQRIDNFNSITKVEDKYRLIRYYERTHQNIYLYNCLEDKIVEKRINFLSSLVSSVINIEERNNHKLTDKYNGIYIIAHDGDYLDIEKTILDTNIKFINGLPVYEKSIEHWNSLLNELASPSLKFVQRNSTFCAYQHSVEDSVATDIIEKLSEETLIVRDIIDELY